LFDSVWVQGVNHCGEGPKSYKIMNIDTTLKLEMDGITGPSELCKGDRYTYTYHPGYFAAEYSWILPAGVSVENVNQNSAELYFSVTIPEGMIIAQVENGCGPVLDTLFFTMDTVTNALLITGDGTLDVPTDQWMNDRLLSEGVGKYINIKEVVVKADDDPVCPHMNCYDLIIVSATATQIPADYIGATVPVIVNNPGLFQRSTGFGLAAEGGIKRTDNLFVFDNTHDITTRTSLGDVPVYNFDTARIGGAGSQTKSIPARYYPNAHSFATVADVDYTNITYLRGEMMMGGTDPSSWSAEGKRLAFFMADSTAELSDDGIELFDRAVCWATNTCDTTLRIQTAALGEDEYCLGDEVQVLFETFPADATFDADNTFLVELSDQNGNFFTPTVIGSKDAVNAAGALHEIYAEFPSNFVDHCIQGGDKYRLRVSATSPNTIGGLNGEEFGDQYITLKSCRIKNYDTIRIYSEMDTTRTIEFCGFMCDSIEGLPQTGALEFDGSSNYINPGTSFSGELVGTPLTLETWIVSHEYPSAAHNQVLFYAETSGGDLRYALYIDRNGRVNLREGPNAQDNHQSVSNVLDNAVPSQPRHHHIAMVLEPLDANTSNLKIYVDGAERFDRDIVDVFAGKPGRAEAGDTWHIGSAGTDQFFTGVMSDARVWNTVRSPEQLAQYKNECPPVATPGLVALYQFGDGAGSTVSDATGSHNGTIVGTADWTTGKNVPCGINDQDYYFYPQLSNPAAVYTQSIALADTLSMTDADLCAGGNQTIIARIPSNDLINNGYYKYRMMAYNRNKGISTPYDAYEEVILVKVRPNNYLIPEDTYVKGLNCYGSSDTAAGRVRFTFNFEGDSIWLPITYYWTKPDGSVDTVSNILHDWQAARDYHSLDTGMYTLHIVDDLGFSETHEFHVTEPDPLELGGFTIEDVLCHGESSGAVKVDIIGGTPGLAGYSYLWNSEEVLHFPDVDSVINLPTGYYHVMIEDRNRCIAEYDSFFVDEPPLFEIVNGLTYTEDVSIKGLNDGAIHITVRGGTGPFSSVHDSVALNVTDQTDTLFSFTNLYAAFYDSIYLIDDNGCEIMTGYEVYEPGAMRIDSSLITPVSCYGGADGSIWVSTTGGVQPFIIVDDTAGIWSQVGDSIFVAEDLPVGDYFFRVEDQSDAFQQRTYSVTSPDSLSIAGSVNDILINSLNTGEITVQVSGGVLPFDFFWDHGDTVYARDARRDTVQELYAGDYRLTVRDANLCVKTADFTVEEDSVLFTATINKTDINCYGFNNGFAEAFAHGGYPFGDGNYQYEWSTEAITKTIDGLQPGIYSVTITDVFDRTAVEQTQIQEPPQLMLTETVESPACDAAFGSIEIEVTGGTQPYKSVEWNTGDTTLVLNDIAPGTYSVTVVDDNDCEIEESFTLADFGTELVLDTLVKRPYCFESADGRIEILVSGGTPLDDGDYEYEWSYSGLVQDPVIEGGVGTNLDNGRYFVTVTDKNNCDAEITIILNYLHEECLLIASGFTPNGDGINDYWEIINIDLFPDAQIFVFDRWRNIVFSHHGLYENDWDGTMNGNLLPVDTYHYIIKLDDQRDPVTGQVTILR
jgi:gliding motility-associated-like protein